VPKIVVEISQAQFQIVQILAAERSSANNHVIASRPEQSEGSLGRGNLEIASLHSQ
jgi:hypothetical protein